MTARGRDYLNKWNRDIYNYRYIELVQEISMIGMVCYEGNNTEMQEIFEELLKNLKSLSKRRIRSFEKSVMENFLTAAVKIVKGQMSRKDFKNNTQKTIMLLKNPCVS